MASWNPESPEDFERAFGLVAIPYFSRARAAVAPGIMHLMMQDGDAASFALHVGSFNQLNSDQLLSWAWSSNVRHALVFDPTDRMGHLRRWDQPDDRQDIGIASISDAKRFIRKLESSEAPPANTGVVENTLRTFNELRTALEERGANRIQIATAFNVAMILAEQWRTDAVNEMRSLRLADAVDQFREKHPWLMATTSEDFVDYDIGEFVQIVLERKQTHSPYTLDAELLIRHASGRFYQEVHKKLIEPAPGVRQPRMFDDSMPSGPTRRHRQELSSVHHTPPWLARALVECAISHSGNRSQIMEILDPACGSGVFLVETVRELERYDDRTVRLSGMDVSDAAGLISSFCVDEASRELPETSNWIKGGVNSLTEDWGSQDIILMNPPFVGWDSLEPSEQKLVASTLGDFKVGKADIYLAFLLRAARSLKPDGVLASVIPFPFFYSESAQKVRDYLYSNEFRVRLICRFRGFRTFDGALVETGAIVISKSQIDAPIRTLVAEEGFAETSVRFLRATPPNKAIKRKGIEISNFPAGAIMQASGMLHGFADMDFADKMRANTETRIGDLFAVRQGVRGIGAEGIKKILLLTKADFDRLAQSDQEKRLFRQIADRIENGRIIPSEYLFFPYGIDGRLLIQSEDELAAKVPSYYREKLLPARPAMILRETRSKWWEADRPRTKLLAAPSPRIVSQEFGKAGNFAFDERGTYAVVGGFAWEWSGTPDRAILLSYLALFNSRVFHRLLGAYCPTLQGLQYRLEKRFVNPVPLPDLSKVGNELERFGSQIHSGAPYDDDLLDSAVLAAYGIDNGDTEASFSQLVAQWHKQTDHPSSISKKVNHPAYKRIAGMGRKAIPWILRELRDTPAHWFDALRSIAQETPVPPADRGNPELARKAWLAWGSERGLI